MRHSNNAHCATCNNAPQSPLVSVVRHSNNAYCVNRAWLPCEAHAPKPSFQKMNRRFKLTYSVIASLRATHGVWQRCCCPSCCVRPGQLHPTGNCCLCRSSLSPPNHCPLASLLGRAAARRSTSQGSLNPTAAPRKQVQTLPHTPMAWQQQKHLRRRVNMLCDVCGVNMLCVCVTVW